MTTVKDICNKYNIAYDIDMESYAENIIDIMNGHMNTTDNGELLRWNGLYCYCVTRDYDTMKKYYLMAIEHGNSKAMANLGLYYDNVEDYDNMKKYYLMAIEYGNSDAMNDLGKYYKTTEEYDMMKKYSLMAIEHDNSDAMNNLGT